MKDYSGMVMAAKGYCKQYKVKDPVMKNAVTGIFAVVFTWFALQSGALAEYNIEMGAYLNLLSVPGGQWLYESENGDEAFIEVLSAVSFKGVDDAGRIRMVSTDTEGVEQTVIEYYQKLEDGLYEIGMENYEGEEATSSLSFLLDPPYKKLVSLPEMDADDDPLESSGKGTIYWNGIQLSDKADYFSSVDIEGIETLVMPFGIFEVLALTCTQSYNHYLLGEAIEETFTLYIEPNLGVLALDNETGRTFLTGIAGITVPGDTDMDADVDGADLTGDGVEENMETLARYFGVSIPVIIN